MNLKQARTLAGVLEVAQPPKRWPEDPQATAYCSLETDDSDYELRLNSNDDLLIRWPRELYIDEDGQLYHWDEDQPGNGKVPCKLEWKFDKPKPHYNTLEIVPL